MKEAPIQQSSTLVQERSKVSPMRCTDQLREVLFGAKTNARLSRNTDINTIHLLLSLLQNSETARDVLESLTEPKTDLLQGIYAFVTKGDKKPTQVKNPRPTKHVTKLLDSAFAIAQDFGDQNVGIKHLLIAFSVDQHTPAAVILQTLHINLQSLYEQTIQRTN